MDAVHEALPARWRVGQASIEDPTTGRWSVSAIGPHPSRGKIPQHVTGRGVTEAEVLRDLDDQLRGVPKPNGTRLDELRRRVRFVYLDAAEEWTLQKVGRRLTRDELGRVIGRYAGR